jgi:nicotinamidase-related amidase
MRAPPRYSRSSSPDNCSKARRRPMAWRERIPQEEQVLYQKAGFAGRLPRGSRPTLLIVDVTLPFLGKRVDVSRAVEEVPTACGEVGWAALAYIQRLLQASRAATIPVVFTRPRPGATTKRALAAAGQGPPQEFPQEITPLPGELVVEKPKASAFFETSLHYYLRNQGVDTVLVAGATTSGCVRASVVDAFSHGYAVLVVEDCVFDRSSFAHAANLFDMDAKYADVVSLQEALGYLSPLMGAHP